MKDRNSTVDILKGIAIIIVIITHFDWTIEERLNPVFPYLIDMAIPVFMVISGYVGAMSLSRHNIKSLSDAYQATELVRKGLRYTIPFLIVVLWQMVDANIKIDEVGILDKIRWVLQGTSGSGSYYYPILMQLIFLLPCIYLYIFRYGKKGLIICLLINALFELFKWAYVMNGECYRLLIFRYIFVIAAGVYAERNCLNLKESVVLTTIGGVFIGLTAYGIYQTRIITFGTSTCFISAMWIIPVISLAIRRWKLRMPPLEYIGKASYNIFLVQMLYYKGYRNTFLSDGSKIERLVCGIIISILIGLCFYFLETPITKWCIKNILILNVKYKKAFRTRN